MMLVLCSCSNNEEIILKQYLSRADEYFWYYNPNLFNNTDKVHLIGELKSDYCENAHIINRVCEVHNDTLYVHEKKNAPTYNIYNGIIQINNLEYFVNIKLQ